MRLQDQRPEQLCMILLPQALFAGDVAGEPTTVNESSDRFSYVGSFSEWYV